ncbi:MAG: chemotaxis protein CheW [Gammaproteobacteria bacterium]|nr:chemotaxis protein CheW [Gammaproteobacteria bacterium]
MTDAAQDELYSLLVPLHDARLIVPRACVAEVVGYTRPDPVAEAPDWFTGMLSWNGRQLPVISFEIAAGQPPPERSGRTRVVVFHAAAGQLQPPFFGVLTQGFPQLVRVNADVLSADPEPFPEDGPVICRIRMLNEAPLIPDLECLERMLLSVLSASRGS